MQFTVGDFVSGKELAQIGRGILREMTLMNRLIITLLLSAATLIASQYSDATEAAGKPDVLFIAIDDLNDWVGAMPSQSAECFLPTHIQWEPPARHHAPLCSQV